MKKIINFVKSLFVEDYLTAEEEKEVIQKIIKKIKEN